MEKEIAGIEIRECADLGPVIARADHVDNAIEVNRKIFYGLPPMVQEFVLCHEVCHLKYEQWDEAETNRLAARLFLDRASSDMDRARRRDFLAYMDGKEADWSNITVAAVLGIITGAFSLGSSVYGIIKNRNAGWYSWDSATQQANVRVMLKEAFEQSRKSSTLSAQDYFWQILTQYTNKDGSLDKFLARSENKWVSLVIAQYEKTYGFGFSDVTPVDWLAFTGVKIALGAVVGLAVFMLVRKFQNK